MGRRQRRHRPGPRAAAAALVWLALAACSGGPDPSLADPAPPTTPPAATASTTTAAPTTTAPPPTSPPPRPVVLAFGGDVYGQPPVRDVLARGENPLDPVAPILRGADVAVVNLETAVGSSGAPRDKEFVFQADPALLRALTGAGVDVVSVANNHSFDHGLDGFLETLDHVRAAGLLVTGGGRNAAEAYAPAIVAAGGNEVAILGVAVIGPDDADRADGERPGTTNGRDPDAVEAAIRAAKARTPIVVVVVHWGAELGRCPRPSERALAQRMLDAGASAVVGAHPHVLQAATLVDGRLVAYSIGNFVFAGRTERTRTTGVLLVTIDPTGNVVDRQWEPARIDDSGRPIPLAGEDRELGRSAYDGLLLEGEGCAGE